ncbi:hypothetical protein LCGC14_0302240 [marine sediment metagenome]|uniref:Resolvase/invertase-type recombinase catalytic domain-containing protein n=1 Tax=marine sediment metagenome TaxID=412755 RepID=A0A0F9WBE7_9ZZZZ|nr:hypothetical protein [Phycisphaerae bacterium]HDZ45157.1 hypothetical protein [Phycisphaerae bacterium]
MNTRDNLHDAVIAYARYSCDRQNQLSAKDQIAELRNWAETEVGRQAPFFEFIDEAVSGAVADRDGLQEAIKCAERYERPLVIVECMSRFARSVSVCFTYINRIVDMGGRFVCIKEGLDTKLNMWPAMAAMMATCAEMENASRSVMVRRGRRAAFRRGHSVGRVGYHYRTVPKDPDDPDGPKINIANEEFGEQIVEYFERVASGQSIAEVNHWASSLPGRVGRLEKWDSEAGLRMIRNPRYKGIVLEGKTASVLERSTGKHRCRPNHDGDTEWREDPKQRFVSPDLWQRANDALDKTKHQRRPVDCYPRDKENRRSGVWPSGALFCGWCGAKMHRRGVRGYSCSDSRGPSASCRNYLQVKTDVVLQEIPRTILDHLLEIPDTFEALYKEVREQARKTATGQSQAQVKQARKRLNTLKQGLGRLFDLVEKGQDSANLQARIAKRQKEIEELEESIAAATSLSPKLRIPTPSDIQNELERLVSIIEAAGEELLPHLRALAPRIDVYPVRIKGARRPALLAKFDVSLLTLLPAEWTAFMRQRLEAPKEGELPPLLMQPIELILTKLPEYVQIAQEAKRLFDGGMPNNAIARKLRCWPQTIRKAIALMEQQSGDRLDIEELTELPDRRRQSKFSPPTEEDEVIPGTTGLTKRIVQTVDELREKGYTPNGIAASAGCRVSTVKRAIKWTEQRKRLDSHFRNSPKVKRGPVSMKRPREHRKKSEDR